LTFRFSAVWGNGGCLATGHGFTNCVTIITRPWGVVDDCTIETGWVVQNPSGSSDFLNNSFGPKDPTVAAVTGLSISVLDFVTAAPAFPSCGISNPNLAIDASGNTPDIAGAGLLALIAPFTFPAGTFATTCSQYVTHPTFVPGAAMNGTSIHGWLQFPPGDPGLLQCGADSTNPLGKSFFSVDGYTTPATSFLLNWGIRLK
jgi:hypothetical protein